MHAYVRTYVEQRENVNLQKQWHRICDKDVEEADTNLD